MDENTIDSEMLVFDGGAVKSLGDGRIGGYGVLFTKDTDLQGDRFSKTTDFDLEGRVSVPVLWAHGADPVLKTTKLARANYRVDDAGIWFEMKLEERGQYEKFVQQMKKLSQMEKLGFSTGSAPHLVKRKDIGGGIFDIEEWPIVELSLTHRPVEPRTSAMALKSLDQGLSIEAMVKSLEEEEENQFTLDDGARALKAWLEPAASLKELSARSQLAEAAVLEAIRHNQVVGNELIDHVGRVTSKVKFRFEKDGVIPSSMIKHVESMLQLLEKDDHLKSVIRSELESLQRLDRTVKSQQRAMDERARMALWEYCRTTGTTPEELEDARTN